MNKLRLLSFGLSVVSAVVGVAAAFVKDARMGDEIDRAVEKRLAEKEGE